MTHVVLIKAGPTPWEAETRLVGNLSLPLTEDARAKIMVLLDELPPIDTVYHFKKNEACHAVAKMVATKSKIPARDNAKLDEWSLGLWQGLRMEELHQRYPTAIEQWEQSPASVVPPEGEAFEDVVSRLHGAVRNIVRRNAGYTIAIPLRPMAMQITGGILRRENAEQIAAHLHNDTPMETISVGDEVIKEI